MGSLLSDVRHAIRHLRAQPTFACLAIGTLAIGIGLSTTLFTIIHATWIRPLPFPDPDQLVRADVEVLQPDGGTGRMSPSLDDVRAWRSRGTTVTHGAIDRGVRRVIVDTGTAERINVSTVSEGYFEMLGMTPRMGRLFAQEDISRSSPVVFIVGYHFWASRLGADAAVLGRVIQVDGEAGPIVGVLQRGVRTDVAVWRPFRSAPESLRGSGATALLRLRDAQTFPLAGGQLLSQLPRASDPVSGVSLESHFGETIAGSAATLQLLSGAVGAILLLACVNVAALLLARGTMRQGELSVRQALGASRGRLVSQLLVESGVLACLGGTLGIVVAWLSLDSVVAVLPLAIPETAVLGINITVLVATAAVASLSAVAFGLMPAVRSSRCDVVAGLSGTARGEHRTLPRRIGQGVIAVQVALAVMLTAGAGLMVRSFVRLGAVPLGFDPASFVVAEVATVDRSPSASAAFFTRALDAIRALPEVEAAGAGNQMPVGGGRRSGSLLRPDGQWVRVDSRLVTPGYFEAVGLPLVQGRWPDTRDGAGRAAIVLNQSAARAIFGGTSAVDQTVNSRLGWGSDGAYEVIGVVADTLSEGARRPSRPNVYSLYTGAERLGNLDLAIFVRPRGGAARLIPQLREILSTQGTAVVVDRVGMATAFVSDDIAPSRHRMLLLGLLGAVGMVLAMVGIFSVTAFAVSRRTREIGIRMALGARPGRVVQTIVGDAAKPIVVGVAVGLGGAFMASELVARFLFETSSRDIVTFTATAVAIATFAALAAWWPARDAARIDPVNAIRGDA